jgi:hypothetical protein
MPTAYEFVSQTEEAVALRCPACGEVFTVDFSNGDSPAGCPRCDDRTVDAAYADDPSESVDDPEESDPCDPYDCQYDNDIDSGCYDDDPNPYSGD